jgi:hypothetical protein
MFNVYIQKKRCSGWSNVYLKFINTNKLSYNPYNKKINHLQKNVFCHLSQPVRDRWHKLKSIVWYKQEHAKMSYGILRQCFP